VIAQSDRSQIQKIHARVKRFMRSQKNSRVPERFICIHGGLDYCGPACRQMCWAFAFAASF
jgi:hypothetical protein